MEHNTSINLAAAANTKNNTKLFHILLIIFNISIYLLSLICFLLFITMCLIALKPALCYNSVIVGLLPILCFAISLLPMYLNYFITRFIVKSEYHDKTPKQRELITLAASTVSSGAIVPAIVSLFPIQTSTSLLVVLKHPHMFMITVIVISSICALTKIVGLFNSALDLVHGRMPEYFTNKIADGLTHNQKNEALEIANKDLIAIGWPSLAVGILTLLSMVAISVLAILSLISLNTSIKILIVLASVSILLITAVCVVTKFFIHEKHKLVITDYGKSRATPSTTYQPEVTPEVQQERKLSNEEQRRTPSTTLPPEMTPRCSNNCPEIIP